MPEGASSEDAGPAVDCIKTHRHIIVYIRRDIVNTIGNIGWNRIAEAVRQAERELQEKD